MIFSSVTEGVIVTAHPEYREEHSSPMLSEYVFAYHIRIENESPYVVQLLERFWLIHDGVGVIKEIEGEGVIGQQPVMKPGDVHEYDSWCPLKSQFGYMKGHYTMMRMDDKTLFKVEIPRFELFVPYLSN